MNTRAPLSASGAATPHPAPPTPPGVGQTPAFGPAFAHGPATARLYLGLMSGTSLDGVDAVLADFSQPARPRVLGHVALPMPAPLRAELYALNTPGHNELDRASRAANALADLYTQAVQQVLAETGTPAALVRAIGAHGQTVRHRPDAGYTIQLNAPARLAEQVAIGVVADVRSRDVAAGGQGAPLVPAFHAAIFGGTGAARAIVNLGGIANVTLLPAAAVMGGTAAEAASGPGAAATVAPSSAPFKGDAACVTGFDTGPANLLLDLWCERHTGAAYDEDGAFAARGAVVPALLTALVSSEPWFALPAPKSTGRDQFHADWLDSRLAAFAAHTGSVPAPADVQATLQALTARTVADALLAQAPNTQDVFVCGGGALNPGLMQALAQMLAPRRVAATDAVGVPAQQVEALAFAWLAHAHLEGLPANLPAVTGARGLRLLGAYYPA